MMRVKAPRIAIARGPRGSRRLWPLAALAAAGAVLPVTAGVASAGVRDSAYRQVNLRSDIPGLAAVTDPDLVNSWGVSASAGTDQAPGGALWVSDNGKDKTTLYTSGTATTVSKAGLIVTITSCAPTGQVSNSDTNPDDFVVHDAAGHSGPAAFIFVSENGGIDGWNPNVGVAAGANPPSPDNFGRFSGALLVGNFGNGRINAYNPDTGAHLGQLRGANGHPIAIEGLWSLRFGNGNAAKTNELIFSSGPDHETHGLLGKLVLAS